MCTTESQRNTQQQQNGRILNLKRSNVNNATNMVLLVNGQFRGMMVSDNNSGSPEGTGCSQKREE